MVIEVAINNQQKGEEFAELFANWIIEREEHNDFIDYIRRGKLNRSEVSKELGFGRSVFAQNPEVNRLAAECDKRWGNSEVIEAQVKSSKEADSARERAVNKSIRTEASNSRLLEKLAKLEAENRQLRLELAELQNFKSARELFAEHSAVLSETYD